MPLAAAVRSAGDAQQVKRGRKIERLTRDQQLAAWQTVLATREGRAVVYGMLVDAGRKDSCWAPDALRMAALVGQRELALKWEAVIREADPEAIARMEREADQTRATQDAELAALAQTAGDEA